MQTAEYEKLIEDITAQAKENLKSHDELLPTFFVGKNKEIKIIGAPFEDSQQKDQIASVIREFAKDADFVIFVSEVWARPLEEMDELEKERTKKQGLAKNPKAQDFLLIHVEIKNQPIKTAMGKINKNREVTAPLKFEIQKESQGRFASFLTSSEAAQ